jgi:hypothetical protein
VPGGAPPTADRGGHDVRGGYRCQPRRAGHAARPAAERGCLDALFLQSGSFFHPGTTSTRAGSPATTGSSAASTRCCAPTRTRHRSHGDDLRLAGGESRQQSDHGPGAGRAGLRRDLREVRDVHSYTPGGTRSTRG